MFLSILLGLFLWHSGKTRYPRLFAQNRKGLLLLIFVMICFITYLSILNLDLTRFLSFPLTLSLEPHPIFRMYSIRLKFLFFAIFSDDIWGRSPPELYRYFTFTIYSVYVFLNSLATFLAMFVYFSLFPFLANRRNSFQ